MPEVVELREVTDRRDVTHRAVQLLSSGQRVILPSESGSVVVASALGDLSKLPGTGRPMLLLRAAAELPDFAPQLPAFGRRIALRCWPGPMLLRLASDLVSGFAAALPQPTRECLNFEGRWGFRVSSHPVLSEISHLANGPLVIREISTTPEPTASEQPTDVSLVVNESSPANAALTVIDVISTGWSVAQSGAIPDSKVQVAACELILFVCTGNTCRSPMAEALCRRLLAERLNCSESELIQRGYLIASAGVAADFGSAASHESVNVMKQRGIDLRSHSSQPLTERLLEQADRCYTMTKGHRNIILENRPDMKDRIQVLDRHGGDILDPIGFGPKEYAACAASIERHLTQILDEIVAPTSDRGS